MLLPCVKSQKRHCKEIYTKLTPLPLQSLKIIE